MKQFVEHTIKTSEELDNLLSQHKISLRTQEGKINLLSDQLTEDRKSYWEDKLSRYFFECGCNMGAKFTVAFLFLYLFYVLFISEVHNLIHWQTIAYGFCFVVAGAVMGKLFGIILYKYLLYLSVDKLKRELL